MNRPASRWRALAAKSLLGACAAAAAAWLTATAPTWRFDAWLYDRLLPLVAPPVDDGIVVVAIDDASLAALGRWPWPREVHAQLVRRLDEAGVRGIGFDVMFAAPDREDPAGDAALAAAIRASGKVVLPVLVDSPRDGVLAEVLPMAPLIDASAGLGHVELDLDRDGVARGAWLYAGLGSAHWPSLALALRNLHAPTRRSASLPGRRDRDSTEQPSPGRWNRDYRILLPYAEPADFRHVPFVAVLEHAVPAAALRDRWVLVGATAPGIGRRLRAPGRAQPMTGVEYHANLLNTLLLGRAITPLDAPRQRLLTIALALLPLLLHRPGHGWRRPWLAAAAAALLALAASALLLVHARLWFAPGATLAVLAAGLAAWLPMRLRHGRRAAGGRLSRLGDRRMLDITLERELASARRANRPLSLLLAEVDDFAGYVAAQGRRAGDGLLHAVGATLLGRARRPRDLAARHDGGTFALLLPECPANAATTIAQSILDDMRARQVPHPDSDAGPFATLSIGIATYNPILESHEVDLFKRAEAALYRARREGRDRAYCSTASHAH